MAAVVIKDFSKLSVIAEGGEGVIYEYKGKVIKCYKPGVDLAGKQRKVRALIGKRLPSEVVAPLEEVVDRKKHFVGYVMERIEGEEFHMLSNKRFVKANHVDTRDVLRMLVCVKRVIEELHKQGIFVGDLNDQNLLFDRDGQIYLIDCDSWTVDGQRCQVAMDLFRDPLLVGDAFSEETDWYAFCVLAFQVLTRLHPFGGTMNPDLHILERMERGISVIDNSDVKIPRTAKSWRNLSPELLQAFRSVFEDGVRTLGDELEEMAVNLKYCKIDQEYYYGKYSTCPLCDQQARISVEPVSVGRADGAKLTAMLGREDVDTVLNPYLYINKKQQVVDLRSGRKVPYETGKRYYFTESQVLIVEEQEGFLIYGREVYVFEKKYKSTIAVEGDRIYYQNRQNSLCEVTVLPMGNHIRKLCSCSHTAYFEIAGGHYGVLNVYDGKLVFCADGINCEIINKKEIHAYGLHYDAAMDSWLVLLEDTSGTFRTLIVHRTKVIFDTEQLSYTGSLGNLCMYRHTIFVPLDGKIRGYAWERDQYKDFTCDIVDADSRLIRKGNCFTIVNAENLYTFGG